ncbi:hypothetical protein OSB04_018705 [Centaurea solstitialis]|uniref:TIR domain-containing protein n=1 Tax=Centaurea solstitialis TaxID=347529 RepID=A0AA38WJK3_9ASTR|nr:hypothetical protein OSB04_018705 [Centaurea solstitialis]
MAISSWFRKFVNGTATVLFRCVLRCFRFVLFMGPPRKQINPSMPSSSSAVDSTPSSSSSSSSQSLKHDVFLSFRGTDTRNTFVDHLYSNLKEKGIDTYKDDKTLPRGETIGPSLLKAIEESQMAVIVFSKNYANSSWCLQELAHIMKCKDERGLIVMPIFYHVDPSELRKQKGKYGVALAKHESETKNVELWRKALVDAGNLSGDVANGPETIFIKQIVDTISNRLCPTLSSDDEDLVGIEARLQDLKSKMDLESDGVLMVGIWGLGGGGKSTLASALYDEISSKFDGSCFVKDVREESSKHGLEELQKKILSNVLKLKTEEVAGDVGSLIKSRFRCIKVLIVLDDVDHVDQLNKLARSTAWFVVSYVGGLPLALKVLGSFLCDKDMSEWMSALARLKDIPENDIVERLKISYDGLKPMEKELFLDIACLFRGEYKDEAMLMLDACGFHPIIGVKVLMQKALITVSEEGTFDMHDLIQEMGHYIVRGENPKNLEKHSRVWQRGGILNIIGMDSMTEKFETEALHLGWPRRTHGCLPEVVANMKKLRSVSWSQYPATSLPRNFQPTKLCYLCLKNSLAEQLWEGYKHLPYLKVLNLSLSSKLISTPNLEGLPCLEKMILQHCTKLTEIHPSIGYHERLTFLDMKDCRSLKVFPPIIRMKKLKTLILSLCSNLRQFPDIQTNMDNLVELCLEKSGIEVVPSSIGRYCTNLLSLDLGDCKCLLSIEGNFRLLKHLERIYLNGNDQLKIPAEGLFDVKCCLQVLSLYATPFKKFHQGLVSRKLLGFPHSLLRLNLSLCNLVDGDISSVLFEELSNLQVLDLRGNKFSRLHSSLTLLPRLKYLNLSFCERLVELPKLPSSIAILIADSCKLLKIVDLPSNLKWLWKVSFCCSLIHGETTIESILQSMLQGKAVEEYFISLNFLCTNISTRDFARKARILELPCNYYDEFSGFLIYIAGSYKDVYRLVIKDSTGWENEDDVLEEADDGTSDEDDVLEMFDDATTYKDVERKIGVAMCYISFGSLRHTTWWNSTHTKISFFIKHVYLKVELVPRRSAGDSIERLKDATNFSEFWDEEDKHRETFEILHDSKSSISIKWCHSFDHNFDYMYRNILLLLIGPESDVSSRILLTLRRFKREACQEKVRTNLNHSSRGYGGRDHGGRDHGGLMRFMGGGMWKNWGTQTQARVERYIGVLDAPNVRFDDTFMVEIRCFRGNKKMECFVKNLQNCRRLCPLFSVSEKILRKLLEEEKEFQKSCHPIHSIQINLSMASSSQSWSYDVFLSFRGIDTRNTFVDHLYSALVQQGIYTYKDDQTLPRGQTIGSSLLKAIEESQIAVIVFSENYVGSSWCLQELEYIMKCKDERGLIVMPIFYHIDPSELRNQKRKYGEAFAKHESENKSVESWRKALVDAGNLSGYVTNGPETIFIKQIVDTISNRLRVALSSDSEDLIGIEARLQDLKSKLAIESDGVVLVGIWGVGGGGKTTLASAVYHEISSMFDGCCFIENVREESSKHDPEELQGKILAHVLKQKKGELDGDVGSLIKSRFRRKKVLMVLDDVDHANQLKALAGSRDWFGEGSRIIITTRDNHLLNAHKMNVIYNISLLTDDEAIKLFCKHAVGHGRSIEDHVMLSKDVVSYAGGLPLALKVLGSFLCDKDKRGEQKDVPMMLLDACGFHPTIGVKVLIQKALITVSKEGRFDKHDLIQEMGHYIVRGENPKNPETHSRIWQRDDILNIIAMDSVMYEVEALQFWWPRIPPGSSLVKVLPKMKKLRSVSWCGCPTTSLPRIFQLTKLCYLRLGHSLVEQLWEASTIFEGARPRLFKQAYPNPDFEGLPCLERIILRGCKILKESHPSIGYLDKLTFLDMGCCTSLELFPPIVHMKKLETLLFSSCSQLRKFPDIQTNMDNLVVLCLKDTGIEVVPSSIGRFCTDLLSLDLSYCQRLQSIEGNFRHLRHLEKIYLEGSDRLKMPAEGLFDIECCLKLLSLCDTSFKKFHCSMVSVKLIGFSRSLVRLNLKDCNLVDGDISSILCELSNVQVLDLRGNQFSRLHSSLSQLPRLKFLNLSFCYSLVELPDLPSGIAVLIADCCDSLEIGDLPTNLKWEKLAVEEYFISLGFECTYISKRDFGRKRCMLELPWNCYYEFSGFLIYATGFMDKGGLLLINDTMGLENEDDETTEADDVSEVSDYETTDEDEERKTVVAMCYISFGSLRHTTWWNSTHTMISFSIPYTYLKVELVPRRNKGDSIERSENTTESSEFWDEEDKHQKTFEILHDSKSSITIRWCHSHDHASDMFRST